ncbi:alpha/beta hydrolase [Nonomuraea angiospora]|uniref:alpha/beta hydrolase n=1 Tax=Nonomuraea angiospora TaxID=46172 RepID=UPI0029A175EA|nr:alpha/beta hydrolase [Nonomuraea angiospora]MDX3110190.1 alpha/beta hydrolase [Nonomuraea angiospora]
MTAKWRAGTAGMTVIAALAAGTGAAAADSGPPRCEQISVAVPLTAGGPLDQRMAGTLCRPRGAARAIQILVPGGTYDRSYWLRRGGDGPSFAETMVRGGYAVLAVDRLGSGRSSWPSGAVLRPDSHQASLHQVVLAARQGKLDGRRYTRVVGVGNSIGSSIIRGVQIRHPDALDGIILTGESSTPNERAFEEFAGAIHPAAQDPRLAARRLDEAYYTTRPGTRGDWFYHRPGARPAVIAHDEATKEPDTFLESLPPVSDNRLIRVPTMIMVGQHDRLLCGEGATDCTSTAALRAQQKRWYPDTPLEATVIPGTGHVLTLHRTAPASSAQALDWVRRNLG